MRLIYLSIVLAFATACSTERSNASGHTVHDSAGIRIITQNQRDQFAAEWWVDAQPSVDLGDEARGPGHQLHRVESAARLDDGRILVANAGSGEILVFDRAGSLVRRIGRRGGGPGEFRALRHVAVMPGDSLLVFERGRPRVSVFDPTGVFVRTVSLQPDTGLMLLTPLDRFADGSLLALAYQRRAAVIPAGLRRDSIVLLRFDAEGQPVSRLATRPGIEVFAFRDGATAGDLPLPFGRRAVYGTAGNQLVYAGNDRPELELYSPEGRLVQLLRYAPTRIPVTDADVEAAKQHELAPQRDDNTRRLINRMFEVMPLPNELPPYRQLVVGTDGLIWLEEYPGPDAREALWRVFAPLGAARGTVRLPADATVLQVGPDFLLLRHRDSLDVERVAQYRYCQATVCPS